MRSKASSALVATLIAVGAFLTGPAHAAAQDAVTDPTVVYLVRHAERAENGTADPPLSVAGQIRVQTLKAILADAGLTSVFSTDYERTRETARPIAEDAELAVRPYDPRDLAAFAQELHAAPGRHLVVGHSNTTPDLVEALGGDPHGTIEEMEYDRLYIVVLPPGGEPITTMLRFGEPYVPGEDFGLRASPGTPLFRKGSSSS